MNPAPTRVHLLGPGLGGYGAGALLEAMGRRGAHGVVIGRLGEGSGRTKVTTT